MKVYLDNNATTKVDEEVVKAMIPYFSEYYGNPFSLHLFGNETGLAVTQARQTIADILKAKPNEIIFTASGSEADNLAIRGIAKAYKHRGKHIITSKIEHSTILKTFEQLENEGYEVSYIGVDENGVVNIEELKQELREDTALVSIMFVNIGMVSGILPVVGVPLPLFSYGGTSYVAIMAAFGLVMSVHTHQVKFMKGN